MRNIERSIGLVIEGLEESAGMDVDTLSKEHEDHMAKLRSPLVFTEPFEIGTMIMVILTVQDTLATQ